MDSYIIKSDKHIIYQGSDPHAHLSTFENLDGITVTLDNEEIPATSFLKRKKTNVARQQINKTRNQSLESGLYIKGIGILDTDPKSVQRMSGATILSTLPLLLAMYELNMAKATAEEKKTLKAAHDSFKTPWITKDNKTVLIGIQELQLIAPALAKNEELHVITARKHKDRLEEADDPQAIVEQFNQELSKNKKERDGAKA